MKLAWRAIRRLRGLPRFFATAYQTSCRPVWQPASRTWRLRFFPRLYIKSLSSGAARSVRRGAALYRVMPPAGTPALRPRILHAIPNVFVGGSTQLIVDIADALGHLLDMRILTSAVPRGARHQGIRIDVVPHRSEAALFARAIADAAPDIVHMHYWGEADEPWYQDVLAATRQAGVPIILNVNTPVRPIVDTAIHETVFVSDYVRERFGEDIAPARVIHPGIDLDRFEMPADYDARALRSIGMIYRLEPDKLRVDSIDVLIEACRARPDVRAVVVGDGSLFGPYVRRTKTAGVRRQFLFAGSVPYAALPSYYRLFRIFVCPVWQESFGQVTPFAMSMGNAVAGNHVGALPEILQSDETLGVSTSDTAALIVALLDDPGRIDVLGRHNREVARRRFDVKTMTGAYEDVYRGVLGRRIDPMADFPAATLFA